MNTLFDDEVVELTDRQLYKRDHNAQRRSSYYVGAFPSADEIERFFSQERLPSMKSSAKQRRKGEGIEFDLEAKMIRNLWIIQKGLCAYTKQPMTLFQNDENNVPCKTNVSVDRIDSSKGYLYDNIVLCRTDVNISKGEWTRNEFLMNARVLLENEHFVEEIKLMKENAKPKGLDLLFAN
jgi:hypothetical protein